MHVELIYIYGSETGHVFIGITLNEIPDTITKQYAMTSGIGEV